MGSHDDKTGRISLVYPDMYEVVCDDGSRRTVPQKDYRYAPIACAVGDRVLIRALPAPETVDDWDWVVVEKR